MTPPKKSPKKSTIPCGVAIIRRGREFLISQRNSDDTFGSYWEFPGGKRDGRESFEDCVVREVMEELGVKIRVEKKFMQLRRDYKEHIIWLNFFLCSYISGEPRPLDCQKVQWADIEALKDFKFPPANELVIARLKELCAIRG